MKRLLAIFGLQQWKTYLRILSGGEKETSLRALLIRGSGGSFILKITNTGLLFLTTLVLTRIMGATGYGIYAYSLSWVSVLLIPAMLGMDTLLVRQVAIYNSQANWSHLKGIVQFSRRVVLTGATLLATVTALVAATISTEWSTQNLLTFCLAATLIPLFAATRLQLATMRGLHVVLRAQLPDMLIRPSLQLLALLTLFLFFGTPVTPLIAVAIAISAAIVALSVGEYWMLRTLPAPVKTAIPSVHAGEWLRSALPMILIASMMVINSKTDIIMIGVLLDTDSAGIYSVATQVTNLVPLILVAINIALAPTIARLHHGGDRDRLQTIITKVTRMMLLASLPIAIAIITLGSWFLALFGPAFPEALPALRTLVFGQLFNVAAGPVGALLVMTGHQHEAAIGVTLAAATNIVLNALLIPAFGIAGAAAATTASIMIWNITLAIFVSKRLGVSTFVFSNMKLSARI